MSILGTLSSHIRVASERTCSNGATIANCADKGALHRFHLQLQLRMIWFSKRRCRVNESIPKDKRIWSPLNATLDCVHSRSKEKAMGALFGTGSLLNSGFSFFSHFNEHEQHLSHHHFQNQDKAAAIRASSRAAACRNETIPCGR